MTLTVGGLWRYPVKSLADEPLASAMLAANGIPGDRMVHVRGPEGVRALAASFSFSACTLRSARTGSPSWTGCHGSRPTSSRQ